MKPLALFAFLAFNIGAGMAQYVPPDFFGDRYLKSIGYWANHGQVIGTNGNLQGDIKFYSEGGFPRIYAKDKSKVSFVIARIDTNIATVDTLHRLDLRPYGPHAREVDPTGTAGKDWMQNFYMKHCGVNGVEEVPGFSRILYQDIFPHIDMHFYSGRMGQKMALVMRPGCDIHDLKLAFNGQDSMKVDLWGNLKIFYDGKMFMIPYVQAYQVNSDGDVVPLSWSASYDVYDGTGVVGFNWSSYNPEWPLVFQIGIPPFGPENYDEEGLCWGTYMGGNENDDVYESVQDENDEYFIAGTTGSSYLTFPVAGGVNYSVAGTVAYVARFDAEDRIKWKSFFGGSAEGDFTRGTAIANKEEGDIYLAGFSDSEQLAVYQEIGGHEFFQGSATGPDFKGFIGRFTKLNGHREWASYFGQNGVVIYGMVGLSDKKVFIVGSAQSTLPDLDVTAPAGSTYWAYQSADDGFISMFDGNDQHAWRTHIRGLELDVAYDVDAVGTHVVVAGMSHSDNLILHPYGTHSYSEGPFGSDDCFLYEFNDSGRIMWSTYVGTPTYDYSFHNGVAIDPITKDIVLVGRSGIGLDVVEGAGWYQDTYPPDAGPAFIARFSGQDRSRTWHTYVHNGPGSSVDLVTCAFDASGNLIIGGDARNGSGVLLQPLTGLYDQAAYRTDVSGSTVEDHDALVLCFGPANQFLYGSYFGGEAHAAYRELIYTVLRRNLTGNIHIAGTTSKEANPLSYFPLDDGGGTPYFNFLFHPEGTTEGFLAAICGEGLVGLNEGGAVDRAIQSHWADGYLFVSGTALERYSYHVFDSVGRTVTTGRTQGGSGTIAIPMPNMAQGTYSIRLGSRTGRFTVVR